jgi:DNA adenine methylase
MGSKARFAKELLPIILADRQDGQWYVEPFAGGMNMISEVSGNRIANDNHPYLIKMWEALVNGWKPEEYSRDEYYEVKAQMNSLPLHIVGWVGFNCSYSGKWFDGYAGKTQTKNGRIRDYQEEARKNVSSQVQHLQGVVFTNFSYDDMSIPANSIIYCDPPYRGTRKYLSIINHDHFWEWVRGLHQDGHKVFVSEYSAPDDFTCVWQKETTSSISANSVNNGTTKSVEKLFTIIKGDN